MAQLTTEVWTNEYDLFDFTVSYNGVVIVEDDNYTSEEVALEEAKIGAQAWFVVNRG